MQLADGPFPESRSNQSSGREAQALAYLNDMLGCSFERVRSFT